MIAVAMRYGGFGKGWGYDNPYTGYMGRLDNPYSGYGYLMVMEGNGGAENSGGKIA